MPDSTAWGDAFTKGVSLFREKKYKESLKELSQAVRLGADRANLYDLRGNMLLDQFQKPKDALKDAKMVIKLAPQSSQVRVCVSTCEPHLKVTLKGYHLAARCLQKLDRLETASAMVDHALGLTSSNNPKHASKRRNLLSLKEAVEEVLEKRRKDSICHVASLPVELLSSIFDFATRRASDDTDLRSPRLHGVKRDNRAVLSVSQVCRHWRQVAIESPQLWQTLVIGTRRPDKKVQFWAKRSNGKLEEVVITPNAEELAIGDAITAMGKHCHRPPSCLTVLKVVDSSVILGCMESAFKPSRLNFTELRFEVSTFRNRPSLDLYMKYPLHSLTLVGHNVDWATAKLENLSSLNLIRCRHSGTNDLHNPEQILTKLGQAASLEVLTLEATNPLQCGTHGTGSLTVLPRLRYLRLTFVDLIATRRVQKVALPALEILHLSYLLNATHLLTSLDITPLTANSTDSLPLRPLLRKLLLDSCVFQVEDLILALKELGQGLEVLTITRSGVDMDPVVEALGGVGSRTLGTADSAVPCPLVREFDFSYSYHLTGSAIKALVKCRRPPDVSGDTADGSEPPQTVPIGSLVIDGCPKVEAQLLPWLRSIVPRVSCVYETAKQIRKTRR
ncbi:hypothetical protein FRB99_008215 [Tulasnella sp. 403]|nr:hypothetical protein FRB99_008215 [Tulasnella sp. 403]